MSRIAAGRAARTGVVEAWGLRSATALLPLNHAPRRNQCQSSSVTLWCGFLPDIYTRGLFSSIRSRPSLGSGGEREGVCPIIKARGTHLYTSRRGRSSTSRPYNTPCVCESSQTTRYSHGSRSRPHSQFKTTSSHSVSRARRALKVKTLDFAPVNFAYTRPSEHSDSACLR